MTTSLCIRKNIAAGHVEKFPRSSYLVKEMPRLFSSSKLLPRAPHVVFPMYVLEHGSNCFKCQQILFPNYECSTITSQSKPRSFYLMPIFLNILTLSYLCYCTRASLLSKSYFFPLFPVPTLHFFHDFPIRLFFCYFWRLSLCLSVSPSLCLCQPEFTMKII